MRSVSKVSHVWFQIMLIIQLSGLCNYLYTFLRRCYSPKKSSIKHSNRQLEKNIPQCLRLGPLMNYAHCRCFRIGSILDIMVKKCHVIQ